MALRNRTRLLTGLLVALALTGAACAPRPVGPALQVAQDEPYRLDTGDRLRITVFGQQNLTTTYAVDQAGMVTLPLIGLVEARGRTPAELETSIETRLKRGFLREPNVAIEIDTYRPFFILGEVTNAGQYPYVPDMTAEQAVAIAGGFSPRARESGVELARRSERGVVRATVPMTTRVRPGDVITVQERWF
jgi:polysaccharide biosynthesis/export protein